MKNRVGFNDPQIFFKIYSLPSVAALYIDVAFHLRKMKGYESVYFLPNEDNNLTYLIKASDAEEFTGKMLKKHRLNEAQVSEALSKFDRVVRTDLAIRVVQNRVTRPDETDKNRFISFDSLMEFIVDQYVMQYKSQVVQLVANLQMSGVSKYDSRKTFENMCYTVSEI